MKKKIASIASFLVFSGAVFSVQAEDFVVPQPILTVPYNGEAELLYNMVQVTWGYYGLEDNNGGEPMTCTLTMPDGTAKTLNGIISDANMEGTSEGKAPTTEDNALSFRNFMKLDEETMQYVQEYGTYKINIPEGTVLVNGVPNPEANLQFTITGTNEYTYMSKALMVYPTTPYSSYASAIQLNWPDQNIYFVEDIESTTLTADIDGQSLDCIASIQQLEGGNEDGTGNFVMDVLYIYFPEFVSYLDGTYLTVNIPEGLVANEAGDVNPSQTVELTLLPQITATLSPEDNSKLESDEAFVTVTWDGINVQALQGTTVIAREVSSRTDNEINVEFGEDASITLALNTLPNGEYEIIIPEAFLIILTERGVIQDSYAINSEIYATYSIIDNGSTGIENIKSENGAYEVFTVDGRPIGKFNNATPLKSLQPGIYIINGKKTFLRHSVD